MEDSAAQQHQEFEARQLVWAKVRGYAWWPGVIKSKEGENGQSYRVDFMSDRTHAFLPRSKIVKYSAYRQSLMGQMKKHGRRFTRALHQAEELWGDHTKQDEFTVDPLETLEFKITGQNQQLIFQQAQQIRDHSQASPHLHHSQQFHYQQSPLKTCLTKDQFIAQLLTKYHLENIQYPKLHAQIPQQKPKRGRKSKFVHKANKMQTKRRNNFKKSVIIMDTQTQQKLLSKKIYSLLKHKQGSDLIDGRQIALNLSSQIIGKDMERGQLLRRLMKWIEVSSGATISSFYQHWIQLQGNIEKERTSSVTNED